MQAELLGVVSSAVTRGSVRHADSEDDFGNLIRNPGFTVNQRGPTGTRTLAAAA